mmetsp:Transcript_17507/g.26105  ORF Transcript_17507/g.26105 Transcript_17507/m.26105 type:complete len:95 (+) Transcript_17507:50-334(+)
MMTISLIMMNVAKTPSAEHEYYFSNNLHFIHRGHSLPRTKHGNKVTSLGVVSTEAKGDYHVVIVSPLAKCLLLPGICPMKQPPLLCNNNFFLPA